MKKKKGLTVMMLFLMRTPRATTITAIRTTATWENPTLSLLDISSSFHPHNLHVRYFIPEKKPTSIPTTVPKSDFGVGAAVTGSPVGGGLLVGSVG